MFARSSRPGLGRRAVLRLAALAMAAPILGICPFPAKAQAQAEDASTPIERLDDGLLVIMKEGNRTPFRTRFDQIGPAIDGALDLESILRTCLGPRWAALPEADQHQLFDTFRRFTIVSYVANFDTFDGERFEIDPNLREVGMDRVVQTRIISPAADPVRIDYVMRRVPAGWRAVDVLLDGTISRVAVQRSDWRALLGNGDQRDVSPLIASLRSRIADLSHGAQLT